MIVIKIVAKDPAQVLLIEDYDMIQTFPTDGSDNAFQFASLALIFKISEYIYPFILIVLLYAINIMLLNNQFI